MKGPFNEMAAVADYNKKLRDKTNGGYIPLEIKYDNDEEDNKKKTVKKTASKAKKAVASKLGSEL